MKFITNKISTSKGVRFEDLIKSYQDKNVKTASVKVAEESKDEAKSSGQLDVEPLHQTGESTTMPKNGPSAKKEEGKKEATVVKQDEEGEDSGQPKWEGEQKNNNEPEKEEVKEAGIKGNCDKCGKPNFLCKCDKGECEKKDDEKTEDKAEDDKKDCKGSSEKLQFVKIANLDQKNKAFLKEYWRQLFGDDYADAMIADK